jgi:hypothetical protein
MFPALFHGAAALACGVLTSSVANSVAIIAMVNAILRAMDGLNLPD